MESRIPKVGLTGSRKKLLAQMLAKRGLSQATQTGIVARQADKPCLAASSQQRLWFIEQVTDTCGAYLMPGMVCLKGVLDVDALCRAIASIVERHEILRTGFVERDGLVYQEVTTKAAFVTEFSDMSGRHNFDDFVVKFIRQPFNLSQGPLLRAHLIKLTEQEHRLVVCMHHIVSDGWSLALFYHELTALYQEYSLQSQNSLAPLKLQYGDYSAWQQQPDIQDSHKKQVQYWVDLLANPWEELLLPAEGPKKQSSGYLGDVYKYRVSQALVKKIRSCLPRHNITLFIYLLAAWGLTLQRISGQSGFLIGAPVAGRNRAELQQLIGFFTNTLALYFNLQDNDTISSLLQRLSSQHLQALENQDAPFEQVVEQVMAGRNGAEQGLFQTMLVLKNMPQTGQGVSDLQMQLQELDKCAEQFDLTLTIGEIDEQQIEVVLSYSTDRFSRAQVKRWAQLFEHFLAQLSQDADTAIKDLEAVPEQQKQALLQLSGKVSPPLDYACDSPPYFVHQLFEQQADKTPDAPAVVMGDAQMSYRALDEEANRLARYLISEGVKRDVVVGICMSRGFELVISQLAILKAGGGYAPLDPSLPTLRLSVLVSGIAPEGDMLVLCSDANEIDDQSATPASAKVNAQLCALSKRVQVYRRGMYQHYSGTRPTAARTGDSLVYVLGTSGSTGVPKLVAMEDTALVALIVGMVSHAPELGEPHRVLQYASSGFDMAFTDQYLAWYGGGSVHLISRDHQLDLLALSDLIAEQELSLLNLPAAVLQQLCEQGVEYPSLRCVISTAEALRITPGLKGFFGTHKNNVLLNHYGPSETHVVTAYRFPDVASWPDEVPIGQRLGHVEGYVLDQNGALVPRGSSGELCIGGQGLARGYLHSPEQTAQRFIPHPFGGEGRLYRTGDLVKCSAIGQLEYLGRCDEQVKIRGFRIELEEVAVQLGQCMGVQSCEVLARALGEDSHSLTLVGYVVCDELTREGLTPENEGAYCQQLRRALEGHLPDYMVPSHIVLLASWPLTHNGKIDRRRLPLPQLSQDGYQAPSNEAEASMQRLWSELLGHRAEDMSVTGSFFDYGGHSLLAVRLVAKIRKAFGREVPVRCVFDTPKLRALTAQVLSCPFTVVASPSKVAVRPSRLPLSYAQKRLWFIDQMDGGSAQYNMPMAFRIWGDFDVVTAEQAIKEIVGRHEILRTVYRHSEAGPQQIVREDVNVPFEVFDLSHLDGEALADETARLCHEDAVRTFDLSEDVMVRSAWLVCPPVNGEAQGVLLFNMHHIASDGVSLNILIAEFAHLYQRGHESLPNEQKHSTLPPLNLDYADFALWQDALDAERYFATHLDYWRAQLAELPEVHSLPLDHSRTQYKQSQGRSFIRHIAPEQVLRLQAIADENLVTLTMLMQTLVALMLSRQANSQDIVLGTPSANRVVGEVQDLMGCFINTLVLRLNMQQKDMPALLSHVKEVNLQALQYQEIPFEQLVDCLVSSRSTQYTPLFQVVFNMNIAAEHDLTLPGLKIAPVQSEDKQCKYDLEIHCHPAQGGLAIEWLFDVNLFELDSVEAFADHLDHIINELCHHKTTDTLSQLAQLPPAALNALKDLNKQLQRHYPDSVQIQQLFEAQVAMQPNALALADNDKQLSYAQVNGQANQLAHCLRERGIGVGDKVGICLSRSVEMVTGLLAVLKCGAAYVPLDPSYPAQRIAYMLKDASPALVLCDSQSQLLSLFKETSTQTVAIDDMSAFSGYREDNLPLVVAQDVGQLAYVIYTSGSTGEPKGVAIAHHSACQLLYWSAQTFDARQRRCMLASTSICFDLSVFELFFPLSCGGTVVVVENILSLPGLSSPGVRLEEGHSLPPISFINTVPSAMKELVRHPGLLKNIAVVALAGEPLPVTLARAVYEQGVEAVYNLYGPSEDTTYSTCYRVPRDAEQMLIGRPVANTRAYVLDSHLQPVPFGVAGELYLAGEGLAQGYLNKADLSASSFVSDPFVAGARMYRTGDLVRYCQAGDLDYLGRVDGQVKIRGFRIELGEIETQLLSHPDISDAAVVVYQDEQKGSSLVAYAVLKANASLQLEALNHYLSRALPNHMLPQFLNLLPQLPLTVNGKINKLLLSKRLPEKAKDAVFKDAQTSGEKDLQSIWAEVLAMDIDDISVDSPFYSLGGNSLLALRVYSKLIESDKWSESFELTDLFAYPTIAQLAEYLDSGKDGNKDSQQNQQNQQNQVLARAEKRKAAIKRNKHKGRGNINA